MHASLLNWIHSQKTTKVAKNSFTNCLRNTRFEEALVIDLTLKIAILVKSYYLFRQLSQFGSLTRRKAHPSDINQDIFDTNSPTNRLKKLSPKACPTSQWDLNQKPSDSELFVTKNFKNY